MIKKKIYKRREIIQMAGVATGSAILFGCENKKTSKKNTQNSTNRSDVDRIKEVDLNEAMSRETILKMLDNKVNMIMASSYHCAQTAFFVLQEQFNLADGEILKALTPLPGLGEKGLTCGAITGSLMALGLVFGRENLNDWETYRASLKPAGELIDRFKEIQGSTDCCDILETEFGERYDLLDPEDHEAYVKAGATEKCSRVVQRAVRIAADIILREKYGK